MDTNPFSFHIVTDPQEIAVDELRASLRAFNQAETGIHSHEKIFITVKDEEDLFLGGVYGNIAWDWLYTDLLWVHPLIRKRGLGAQLMRLIENEADSHKVFGYHLSTASFQALGFYQKLGYQIAGEIENLPPGHTSYFLKKLASP